MEDRIMNSISDSLPIPRSSPLYGEVKTIGIWMSGGIDSSLLAWKLADQIEDHDLCIKLQPFTVRRSRPYNPFHAEAVLEKIYKGNHVLDMITYYPDKNDPHQCDTQEFIDRDMENFTNGVIQIMYSGISQNPPLEEIKATEGWYTHKNGTIQHTETNRDKPGKLEEYGYEPHHGHYINPWSRFNKKDIASEYKRLGLWDIFEATRSCEGDDGMGPCGICWWCFEKKWAFGRL